MGTWDIGGDVARGSVRAALDADYRHVDAAEGSVNESEIGETVADHVRENCDAFDRERDGEDRHRLDAAGWDDSVYDFPARDWAGDVYGISE